MLLSEGQMSDYKGAALMLPAMPKANALLADKGYDADWLRAALAERGLAACIPSKSNRKAPIPMTPVLYKQRHKIENMFGRLKLAAHPYPLRSLCSYLLLGNLRRRSRRLLALIKQS
jgi:transposase